MTAKSSRQGGTALDQERMPPHSVEAEMCVLGSMIINPDCVGDVIELIDIDSFYKLSHRPIFHAITELFLARTAPDIVAVKEQLAKTGKLEEAGGYDALAAIVESVPNASNATYYAAVVRDKALLRQLLRTCEGVMRDVYASGDEADKIVDEAQSRIFELSSARGSHDALQLGSILQETFRKIQDIHDRRA
jgi:replicative DNA helicase